MHGCITSEEEGNEIQYTISSGFCCKLFSGFLWAAVAEGEAVAPQDLGGTGTLALSLTDAPSVDYEAVYVTIERVKSISAGTSYPE